MTQPTKQSQTQFSVQNTNFRFVSLQGDTLSAEILRGKVVVLNFWFIGCKPCVAEIPELNVVVDAFKDKDVVFIAPALDGKEALLLFQEKYHFAYRLVPGVTEDFVRKFTGDFAFPTHIIIDRNGVVRSISTGGKSKKELLALTELITGFL